MMETGAADNWELSGCIANQKVYSLCKKGYHELHLYSNSFWVYSTMRRMKQLARKKLCTENGPIWSDFCCPIKK